MKKILYIFLLVPFWGQAQNLGEAEKSFSRHSLAVSMLPSFTQLNYQIAAMKSSGKFTLSPEISYQFRFIPELGISLGVSYTSYISDIDLSNTVFSQRYTDGPYSYILYQENHQVEWQCSHYLNLPLMLRLEFALSERLSFQGGLGVQFGWGFSEKTKISEGYYQRTAIFEHIDVVIDDLPEQGLGRFTDFMGESAVAKDGILLSGVVDAGLRFQLAHRWSLAANVFASYSFNDMRMDYTPYIRPLSYQGIVSSDQSMGMHALQLGLKIGLHFHF